MTYNSSLSNSNNMLTSNLAQPNDFKFMLQTSEQKICSISGLTDLDENQTTNVYHFFLRYLYLNIKENNLPVSGNSTGATSSINNAWRTFKGRLYTRLHDKRIADLDMNGIVNVAYLFYVLIKCFGFSSLTSSQLRLDQLENYFRILNVFLKSKNLSKVKRFMHFILNLIKEK